MEDKAYSFVRYKEKEFIAAFDAEMNTSSCFPPFTLKRGKSNGCLLLAKDIWR